MTIDKIERQILIDEPSSEDLFHGKGHERTAKALAKAIGSFYQNDRAIGLDGPWGSGKSSIVEIAEKLLSGSVSERKTRFHFFTYDIWKSQGSSFRRSLLEHFLDWSKAEFPKKSAELEGVEKRVRGKVKVIHTNNQAVLDWYGISMLLLLPFLPIYYFWAKHVFDKLAKDEKTSEFFCSYPFFFLLLFLLATFGRAWWRYKETNKSDSSKRISFLMAISQTLLISTKQYEDQKVTQHIREIDPNDFEFHSIFREILAIIQAENERVVLVLDNIDRLPGDEIKDHWALVRSVFSRGPVTQNTDESSSITAIVPYDRHHIEVNDADAESDSQTDISSLSNREVFAKTFDEILTVAPPVMSNSREFFHEKIRQALPNFTCSDDLFGVYLIFNKILEKENGTATPRQVISFINELTGLYVLHDGSFRLPTIAIYIAYQDALEKNPAILSKSSFLDERMRAIAADTDLERNLAAMIFNVERGLAFQLLLDDRIKNAATSSGASELIALAASEGFDLRVNEVVLNNIGEWQSSGEFGEVVENFASLIDEYDGDAGEHFSNSLVNGFFDVEEIDLDKEAYSPYLGLFRLSDDNNVTKVTEHLVHSVLRGVNSKESNGFQGGEDWITFLDQIHQSLTTKETTEILDGILDTVSLPSTPEFVFGMASSTPGSNISFKQFEKVTLSLSENEEFLENMAKEYPQKAQKAFSEFKSAGILGDDQWVAVGNSLLLALADEEMQEGENLSNQLIILSDVWVFTDTKRRAEIELDTAFGDSQFYLNIYENYSDDVANPALAHALFLAGQGYLKDGLSIPNKTHPNGQKAPEDSSEFEWFKEMFDGEKKLADKQYETIAKQTKRSLTVSNWLDNGQSSPDNQFIAGVMEKAFSFPQLPWIHLTKLMSSYGYLKLILSSEFDSMLASFGSRISTSYLSDVRIETCPIGLLTDTQEIDSKGWKGFHQKIDELLQAVPASEWREHLEKADDTSRILLEKISTTGFSFKTPEFRDVFVGFVFDVLSGQAELIDQSLSYDGLIEAIDNNYHPEIYRKVREDLRDVTASSLESASQLFPEFLSNLLSVGERITQKEKNNVIRYLLCSALEGDNRVLLQGFLDMGRSKVSRFIKDSDEITQQKKEGAWKIFVDNCEDHDWRIQIGELVQGKRKAKTFFEKLLGVKEDVVEAE